MGFSFTNSLHHVEEVPLYSQFSESFYNKRVLDFVEVNYFQVNNIL